MKTPVYFKDFQIQNTLTRQKEKFVPVTEGKAGLYTCGPTVYNYAHIGNLRTYIFEDILAKALKYHGYEVRHVMNVTDVGHLESDADSGEDKMMMGAMRENRSPWEIARYYESAFFLDLARLNVAKPDVVCRATEHIPDMIRLIRTLEEKGYTYIADGNVYFSIDKFPDYNRLANLSLDKLQAGSRVEVDGSKRNPLDFVLWFTNSKFKNHIMQWDSPWGTGFPGWHVECSAMAIKYLGEHLDIHCGGIDHIAVHHSNEIAQSEGALGHKWVNYWLHSEFLVIDGAKMSKSSGDFLTLSRLEQEGFDPLSYRFLCLQSRYRKKLLFSFDTLRDAENAYLKLKKRISALKNDSSSEGQIRAEQLAPYVEAFSMQLGNDLNIPNALTVLLDVLKDSRLNTEEKLWLTNDFDRVLSLNLTP